MATQIIANVRRTEAAELHAHALSTLREWEEEIDRVFAVAAAGRTYCGDDQPVHKSLFEVVEEMLSARILPSMLRDKINDLARSAGVSEGAING